MIIVSDDACVNLACQDSTWVVDTAASFHITVCRDFFFSYTSGSFGWVRMENEAKCEIVGMRDVKLETSIGCKLILKDVRHVPEIRFSLIPVRKLDDEGYQVTLERVSGSLLRVLLFLLGGRKTILSTRHKRD